ncbi:LrgA family protein [Methylocella silvestris BL2]|uniref:LrgA family protein n=1 Tax=Methylocella silvestris (strain DSM 15510 / CIP 108128 / LMG 27833 / NCIMB 13906 / BL2) TaxID=395965 RepID=B8EKN7_METSB|nr:CidA/LrgA family protein [Methylocella silvestris]ACK51915.1 LrgA family protein [Methylocella silvestris BL2]
MVRGFVLLLMCQLAGEAFSRALGLPVPGPVLGLVLLFLGLQYYQRISGLDRTEVGESDVGRVADGLLQNLALLFVPAGVGVVQHLKLIEDHGLAIAVVLIGSTAITLIVTVLVFVAVARWVSEASGESKP